MQLLLLLLTAQAFAESNTPPTMDGLTWYECIEIDCYLSAYYPVPINTSTYLGTIVQRGPSPITISDACEAVIRPHITSNLPIHGAAPHVYTTEADSGSCRDTPPYVPPVIVPEPIVDADKIIADLERQLDPTEPFDPDAPDGVEWP